MPRKKKVEEPVVEAVPEEVVDVSAVVPEIEEFGEAPELIWVETVDAIGRHMIQVPKE